MKKPIIQNLTLRQIVESLIRRRLYQAASDLGLHSFVMAHFKINATAAVKGLNDNIGGAVRGHNECFVCIEVNVIDI